MTEFNFGLVVSHENQHDETMLQALNLRSGPALLDRGAPLPPGRPGVAGTSVLVAGGPFVLGVDAADEPLLAGQRTVRARRRRADFRIGRVPVTNAEWRQFIDDGGYREPRWWSERGWSHRRDAESRCAAVLGIDRRQSGTTVRPRRGASRRRARAARDVLRGRGVRGVGRCPAAHRGGVGEGVRMGSRRAGASPVPVGCNGTHRRAGESGR